MAESVVLRKSFEFALEIIVLYRQLQAQQEYVLSKQLLRSGTSIGANIEEANAGQSKRDWLSSTYEDNKILWIVGWVRRGDNFDEKPIAFYPRRNPPFKGL